MASPLWVRIRIILGINALLLMVHLVNIVLAGRFLGMGIIPRDLGTSFHILTAPFIHASFQHLLNNMMGLSIFAGLFLLRSIREFIVASIFIVLVTGVLVWIFARPAIHIGASGWVFGLWSFSIISAWFDRSLKNSIIAFFVLFLYGGMIYGVLPTKSGVSFESHLFGVISGIIIAALLAKRR